LETLHQVTQELVSHPTLPFDVIQPVQLKNHN